MYLAKVDDHVLLDPLTDPGSLATLDEEPVPISRLMDTHFDPRLLEHEQARHAIEEVQLALDADESSGRG